MTEPMSQSMSQSILPHPITGVRFSSPVPPGSGWPDDPAADDTPVATTAAEVHRLAASADLPELAARVSVCRACSRLVAWREEVAHTKRAAYAHEPYWGRPIHGWGSPRPRVVIVGLAPGAHGANRTGRNFTGDRSGDWLYGSLYRVNLAGKPTSTHAGDGQYLPATRMIAAVRCAPPANKPTTTERDTCAPWLASELGAVLATVRVVVALGSFGWDATLRAMAALGYSLPQPRPRFGHGAAVTLMATAPASPAAAESPAGVAILASYHPSQQNTFTGRLTEEMLDDVLGRAAVIGLAGEDWQDSQPSATEWSAPVSQWQRKST
ncbi:MAG: uracil-DNA glycosylase [Nocardioides sp.]